jgi:hypothetical protein
VRQTPAGIREAGPAVSRSWYNDRRYVRSREPSWANAASRTPGLAEKAGREGDTLNGTPRLDSDREQDMGGLAILPGLMRQFPDAPSHVPYESHRQGSCHLCAGYRLASRRVPAKASRNTHHRPGFDVT